MPPKMICTGILKNGGLGDAIAQLLSSKFVAPQEFVAVDDRFGESGTPSALLKKYGLETDDIIDAARKVVARKP